METATNDYVSFAGALGLEPGADDLFVGKRRGFPVGLKFIDPGGAVLLLFQVRHWLGADAPQLQTVTYTEEIQRLLAEKSLEIELDDRIAWVTFTGGEERIDTPTVGRRLDSILEAFVQAGLVGDPEVCHDCRSTRVSTLSSAEGKVAQLCPDCLQKRLQRHDREVAAPGAEAVPILLMSPAAALVGAVLWAGFWIGQTLLVERVSEGTLFVPRLAMLIVMVCIGFLVGGPVGWIIRQNRRRGHAASVSAAILFGSLAVAAGEILYLAWLIYRHYHVFSLSAAVRVLPRYYLANDPFFLAIKALTAVVCVSVAYLIAKPEKARLKL